MSSVRELQTDYVANGICPSVRKQQRHLLEYKYFIKTMTLPIDFSGSNICKCWLMSLARIIARNVLCMYAPFLALEIFSRACSGKFICPGLYFTARILHFITQHYITHAVETMLSPG
jgi:hypothetical protein